MKKHLILATLIAFSGCVNAARNAEELHSRTDENLTVGVVQREIRNGMSGADVVTALGSPNIVTKDGSGSETWVYDKIASEASYSNSNGAVGGLGGVGGDVGSVLLLGLFSGSYDKHAGASALSQRTLTVVIKFDDHQRVSSATYRSSSF